MNNPIINFKTACLGKEQTCALNNMIALVARSISMMENKRIQLDQIAQNHLEVFIRMEAEDFLIKQDSVIKIGYELLARILKSLEKAKSKTILQEDLIQQFLDEIDLLNFMNFEVTKKYFSFLELHKDEAFLFSNVSLVA